MPLPTAPARLPMFPRPSVKHVLGLIRKASGGTRQPGPNTWGLLARASSQPTFVVPRWPGCGSVRLRLPPLANAVLAWWPSRDRAAGLRNRTSPHRSWSLRKQGGIPEPNSRLPNTTGTARYCSSLTISLSRPRIAPLASWCAVKRSSGSEHTDAWTAGELHRSPGHSLIRDRVVAERGDGRSLSSV
jgi:hypothetical protein